MDYKTTMLTEQLECQEVMLPDFPQLHYGTVKDGPLVFDSTAFFEATAQEILDYKTFQRLNRRYIESFIANTDAQATQLFYINKDGHILMHHELTFLFLAYAQPELATYFNGLIGELFSNGVAYSDGFVIAQASQKIPTEVLQRIIESRTNNGNNG